MNILRKITLGLLVSFLAVGSASAALNPAQKARVRALVAQGLSPALILADLEAGSDDAPAVDFGSADLAVLESTMADIVAEVPPAQVAAVTQAATAKVVATVAATGGTSAQVAAVARAAASGASKGAVTAASNAPGATATTIAAAAQAASTGSTQGAVAAVTAAAVNNPTLNVATVTQASATGASSGAITAAAASGSQAIINAVSTASTTGATTGATNAGASPAVVAAANTGSTSVSTTTTTTGTTTTTTVVVAADPVVEVPATDNVIITKFATVSFQLSNGSFVNITVNDQNALTTVTNTTTAATGAVVSTQVGNGGSQDFGIPADFFTTLGTSALSAAQQANIVAAINAAVAGLQIVNVPGNVITVSPSS